jgi:adenylosuccinate lyase
MAAIWSTPHKLETWLRVELALVETLEERHEAPKGTLEAIRRRVVLRPERVDELEETLQHDVIAFLTSLTEQLGPEGSYLHYGMTSSDLLDTALSLLCLEACDLIQSGLERVLPIVREKAVRYRHVAMVGRTHGVHAEPITLGLKLLVWFEELKRHESRLSNAREDLRVGKLSGSVGTLAHLPMEVEERTLERLGLRAAPVSTQILQRDRHAHLLQTLALLGASLDKFATEIRNLQRTEIRELQEPFRKGQKGSSSMPHKRNPIFCERITGLARLLRSYVVPALENVVLWHERDISHSSVERVILPDAFLALDYALDKFATVMDGLVVDEEHMRRNLEATGGLVYSQKVLLALTRQLGSREKAYAIVQEGGRRVWEEGGNLKDWLLKDPVVASEMKPEELDRLMDPKTYLGSVDAIFRRALGEDTQL